MFRGRDQPCEKAQRREEAVGRDCGRPVGQKCGQRVLGREEATEVVGGEALGLDLRGKFWKGFKHGADVVRFLPTLHLFDSLLVT